MIKNTIPEQTLNYFNIQSNLDKMTVISLMMMTFKITLSTTAIATRYSDFLLLLDSNSTRSKKPLLAGTCLRLSFRSAWAYKILWFPPTEIASDTQCVFVFFFFRKTQKHIDPIFFVFFFNNKIAPESQCVFVFLCFFLPKNTKITLVNLTKKTQKDIKHKLFEKNCNEEKKHKKHIWSFSAS